MIVRLIKVGVSLAVALGDGAHRQALRLVGRNPASVFTVLYYHGVLPGARRSFARQMDDLLRIATPVRADESQLPPAGSRYAAVTFDDGFVSVVENALPELHARRIPCTIFVPSGSLGGSASWLGKDHLDAAETVVSPQGLRALGADELVTIGSHSITHPNFRRLDDGTAGAELEQSKSALEEILNERVNLFSFPHGACNDRSIEIARRAGYTRVFTIDPVNVCLTGNAFVCGRVKVEPDDWTLEFRLKARGAYRWLSHTSAWKKRLQALLRSRRDTFRQPVREVPR